jgi:quaternary ammonium compound-resistance protein SugE
MAWLYLFIAGIFEIVWATSLKYTEGFTRLWPSVTTAVAMALSVWLLAVALKTIPVGTGYAIWTGIGAAGTAVMGMLLFGESKDAVRVSCIVLIIAGIVGLKLASEP